MNNEFENDEIEVGRESKKNANTAKKNKTKKRMKIYRIFTYVFAILFLVSAAAAVFFFISSAAGNKTFKNEISNLRADVNDLNAENLRLKTDLQALTAQNTELQEKYDNLNISTADFQTTITELQNQLTAMNIENDAALSDLQEKYNSVSSQLAAEKKSNENLTSKNTSLSSQVSSLNSQISSLKKENKILRETLNDISGGTVTVPETEPPETEGENGGAEETGGTVAQKIAYLTFDDGVSKYTDTILDILAEYGVKATFFPIWKSGNDNKYKRIVNEGHVLGNHTYTHEYDNVYTTLEGFKSEVQRLNDKLTELTGYTPVVFRFPGGSGNTVHRSRNANIMQPAIQAIYDMGMQYYDWNVNSGDADSTKGASKDEIVKNVLSNATMDKAIILLHDTNTKGTSVAALPEIIEGLIAKGYTFSVLTDGAAPVIQQVKKS